MGVETKPVDKANRTASMLGGLSSLAVTSRSAPASGGTTVDDVLVALNEFSEIVRYLNTRRSTGTVLALDSEADVQDALYIILRPWVRDLVWETPTDRTANRFTIRDFVSRSLRVVIEAKYVRDEAHGKLISRELHDDIEVYRHNPVCDTIIFFIYDPNALIPDGRELRRTIEETRAYGRRTLVCKLVIKP
jgi:hypothetical protein